MNSQKLQVQILNLTVPLEPPVYTPKRPIATTYLLIVFIRDKQGHRGVGYSSFRQSADLAISTFRAKSLLAEAGSYLTALINVERIEETASIGSTSHSKAAANALSLAVWDLLGQQSDSCCADLWGRQHNRESLECYASAFWLNKSIEELVAEAKLHVSKNYRLVKMRVGRSIEESLQRIAAVEQVYKEPRTIALETGSDWDVEIANQFLCETPGEYLWIEDPAPYDSIGGVENNSRNAIAAGEKCTSLKELLQLYSAGIRNLILDVQYLGGPLRFLEAARLLNALGATVGGHRFSHYSIHLLATLPTSLPVEMLDWTNPAFLPLADPDRSGRLPVSGPGFGISLDQSVIDRYGVSV